MENNKKKSRKEKRLENKKKDKQRINATINTDILIKIKNIATVEFETMSDIINKALKDYIDKKENKS